MAGASKEHLWLLATGREVPLGFVREGSKVFLVAGDRASRWPVDALREGRVTLRFADGAASGPLVLVADPTERRSILERFRTKYGDEAFARFYESPARVLRVDLGAGVEPGAEARYRRWLEAEFDNVADDYDRHILGNRMNRLLRDRSLSRMRPLFSGRRRLLEVGCGSGMETLPLLEEGHEILAVDISERMLRVVEEKARAAGVRERLTTSKRRAADLGGLVDELGAGSFDGAYSTYGALNAEVSLDPVVSALEALLPAGAPFFAGVYNRWCLFELAGYGLTGQPGRAFGRAKNPIRVGASRFCIDVFAYSAWEFARRCAPAFSLERLEGVPVLLPPSDLVAYAERFSRRFETLARWDRRVGSVWPFRALGDHFLATLRRGPGPAAPPGPRGRAADERPRSPASTGPASRP